MMPEAALLAPNPELVRRVVSAALDEDGARNDVTTHAVVSTDQQASAVILAKQAGILAGLPVAATVFALLDDTLTFKGLLPDGSKVVPGQPAARIKGSLAPILSGERVALNFVQRLSGIATVTRQAVDAVTGLGCRILDTRKTTPGLRSLERYAVRAGGGYNHRFNLADAVLIKDNHLAAARLRGLTISDVLAAARKNAAGARIEIEVTSIVEAREALAAGAKALLLDNMTVDDMRFVLAEARTAGGVEVEASGGVAVDNVRTIAETGVNFISLGALTHSATALDLSLEVELG